MRRTSATLPRPPRPDRDTISLRLALINYEYPPLGGGAGNATACIARALARQDHDVTVLTSGFGALHGSETEGGLQTIRLRSRRKRIDRSNYGEMLSFVVSAGRALPRVARTVRPDGAIVFFSLPCGPLGWLAKRASGVPYVISLRGGDVPGADENLHAMHRVLAPLRRALLRDALSVVANSKGLADLSQRADRTPVEVIPNGVDADFFCPGASTSSSNGTVDCLYAGRLQAAKNLFVLLEQFAKARERASATLTLTLIGDGPQAAALKRHARTLGIEHRVRWTGWLDKEGTRNAYRDADIFINPSLGEGMPNAVLEAMACGLPVIASRVVGNDEVVRHGETGLLFALGDSDGLASAIGELADAPERRGAMARQARRIASEYYSWDATAAQYAALFSRRRDDARPSL